MTTQTENTNQSVLAPIVMDLGKTKKKKIKRLKRGRGALLDDVHQAISMVKSRQGEALKGKACVPIVLVYKKKKKKRKWKGWGFWD